MRFIRQQRSRPGYDPDTRHVIFGQARPWGLILPGEASAVWSLTIVARMLAYAPLELFR